MGEVEDQRLLDKKVADDITKLQSEDWITREEAVKRLGVARKIEAFEPLVARLEDENDIVRREAAGALGMLGDNRAVEPLIKKAMTDPSEDVRLFAVFSLSRLSSDSRAFDVLMFAASRRNYDTYPRTAAIRALGVVKDKIAVDLLLTILEDEKWETRENRKAAISSLATIGDQRAIRPLIAALKDNDNSVHESAERALLSIIRHNNFIVNIGPQSREAFPPVDITTSEGRRKIIEELEWVVKHTLPNGIF